MSDDDDDDDDDETSAVEPVPRLFVPIRLPTDALLAITLPSEDATIAPPPAIGRLPEPGPDSPLVLWEGPFRDTPKGQPLRGCRGAGGDEIVRERCRSQTVITSRAEIGRETRVITEFVLGNLTIVNLELTHWRIGGFYNLRCRCYTSWLDSEVLADPLCESDTTDAEFRDLEHVTARVLSVATDQTAAVDLTARERISGDDPMFQSVMKKVLERLVKVVVP